ncbi:hypothetical protein BDW02DRAFT_61800 [Decorospora gaudefroyi]|uniref:Uncharacterized protein n=1 Tax=Decorospora gaudefroyi TaxID=184978 RepID=A0A6A5K9X5_9PLEO|nr:hypothetical protein BDW02DRAFT_61800 [Decorospora gaudefroyi]
MSRGTIERLSSVFFLFSFCHQHGIFVPSHIRCPLYQYIHPIVPLLALRVSLTLSVPGQYGSAIHTYIMAVFFFSLKEERWEGRRGWASSLLSFHQAEAF